MTVDYLKAFFLFGLSYVLGCGLGNAQPETVMPAERVYLHNNSALLFPGDYLYYKCYVQQLDSKKLSKLSKVVYAELVNEKGSIVFSHKLFTEDGEASGDFFIEKSLETGNYKLIAFTQWMKNQGLPSFFQSDISIINPYAPLPESVSTKTSSSKRIVAEGTPPNQKESSIEKKGSIRLRIEKDTFEQRDGVILYLEALTEDAGKGSYSISVRKKGMEYLARHIRATAFDRDYKSIPKGIKIQAASVLPELRGELLSGKVVGDGKNKLVKNRYVVLSNEDEHMLYNIAKTDEEGHFYFNIAWPYENKRFALRAFEDSGLALELFPKSRNDYSNLKFRQMHIDTSSGPEILEKSVHNQIENAFASVKTDSILPFVNQDVFDRKYLVIYDLDDFTRFATLKESIQEIIAEVGIKKIGNKQQFSVRTDLNMLFNNNPPLILVDGLFISDHSKLLELDSREIQQIQVFTSNFFKNGIRFKGAILIQTKENNDVFRFNEGPSTFELDIPQKRKKYYQPFYGKKDIDYTSVPDFRYQLLWQPNLVFREKKLKIEFYCSDVIGDYEIFLEGFTQSGKPVSLNGRFEVKK